MNHQLQKKDDSLFTLLGNYYLLQNSQVSFILDKNVIKKGVFEQ